MKTDLSARIHRFVKMATADNMPGCISAHYLWSVLFPQLARVVGVEHVAAEMNRNATKALAIQSGLCCMCWKAEATEPDDGDWYCNKCFADFQRFCAEAEIDHSDDIPIEFVQMVRNKCAEEGIEATPDEVRAVGDKLVRIAREVAEPLGIAVPKSDMAALSFLCQVMRGE